MIIFTVEGRRHELTREQVEAAVEGLQPEAIQSLAVEVARRWWPAKQPFVAALGLRNTDVNSRTALRNLQRLGFRTHDQATMGPLPDLGGEQQMPALAKAGSGSRDLSLSLAVELGSALGLDVESVLAVADRFQSWLGQ